MGLITLNEMKSYLGIGGIVYPSVTVNLSINTVAGTITRSSGSWTTDKVVAGSLLTLAGFTTPANNDQIAVEEVVSATVIKYLGPVGLVTEVGVGTSFDQADPANNTTYDTFLTEQIEIISEAIENYCRRKFMSASYVQTFYKEELVKNNVVLDTMQLYHFPLVSVASVKEIWEDTLVSTTLPTTDYRLNFPVSWVIKRGYYDFFTSGDMVEVTYTAGYSVLPYVIKNAIYSLVQERYNKKVNGIDLNFGSDVQSISIPGTISVAYDYSLNDNDRKTAFGAILGKYVNTLDFYRNDRAIYGNGELVYL